MDAALEALSNTSPGHLRAGDILGTYQLLCPIAHGGMGQIWVACRTGRLGLPRLLAIKTALPRVDRVRERLEELFFDEARVAVSIDHPNVCKTYELGEEQGILYIVMEWIDGASLANLVSAASTMRRLDYGVVAYIVAQACAGLHAAHELNDEEGKSLHVVHRDATPQNILIAMNGDVKVVDFGVVKSRDQAHQTTMTGELKGKISYLAPEQLLSRAIDRRTDIFALGCVLYYATTSKRAFSSDSAGETMLHIMQNDYVPPSCFCTDYPEDLEAIIVRAMATDPADRFQTADEMRKALEAFLRKHDATVNKGTLVTLMEGTFGEAIEQRRAEIRAAQRLFESQRARGSDGRLLIPMSGSYPLHATQGQVTGSANFPPALFPTERAPSFGRAGPTKRRGSTAIALGGGLAGLAAGVALALRSFAIGSPHAPLEGTTAPRVARAAEVAPPASSSEPLDERQGERAPELVTITVRTIPPHAMLAIDDGIAIPTPYTLTVPRDEYPHQLQARATHYGTVLKTVMFDRTQTLVLELHPQHGGTAPAAAPIVKGATQASMKGGEGAGKSTSPKAVEGQKPSEERTPVSHGTRPRRPIDESDPFRE